MNYYINAISWRNLPKFPIELTDFTDFTQCYELLASGLSARPGAYLTLSIQIEADDPVDDHSIIVQYYREGEHLSVILCDEHENCLHDSHNLFIKSNRKIFATGDGDLDPIVKIIIDYGSYAVLGIQWALFLLKEGSDGDLKRYFEDLYTQEIH